MIMTITELKKKMGLTCNLHPKVLHPKNDDDMCCIKNNAHFIPYWIVKQMGIPDEEITAFQSIEEYNDELKVYNDEQDRLKKLKQERDATMPF